jgi:3-oxoadipate enol-lactonase
MKIFTKGMLIFALLICSHSGAKTVTLKAVESAGVTDSGIHYTLITNGRPDSPWMIMIHGLSHDQRYFKRQVDWFKPKINILLVDFRGHGKSSSASGPFGYEEYADDVYSVVDQLDIESAHYLGSHTGSTVGLVLALRHPGLFKTLVLEGGFANDFPIPETGKVFMRSLSLSRDSGIVSGLENWWSTGPWFDQIRAMDDADRVAEHRNMVFDFKGELWLTQQSPREKVSMKNKLNELTVPVLLVNGEFDSEEFKRASANLKSRLSNSTKVEISNSGGFPIWENPEEANIVINKFLNKGHL